MVEELTLVPVGIGEGIVNVHGQVPIDDDVHLLSPDSIEPIQTLKTRHLGSVNPRLHTDEVLIALSVSASSNPDAALALEHLRSLRGCDAHITTILGLSLIHI